MEEDVSPNMQTEKAASTYSLLPSFYGTIDLEYVNDSGEGEMERVAG